MLLAHLVADFVLQTDGMVADKRSDGRRGWRGLAMHGGAVAVLLLPFVGAWGLRGAGLLAIVTLGHVVVDRWKVAATRRSEARALAAARRAHLPPDTEADALGPAWTPVPGALFAVDQLLHVALLVAAWAAMLAPVAPSAEWSRAVDAVLPEVDRAAFHAAALTAVVLAALLIVNVRAGALFVATLVQPRGTTSTPTIVEAPDRDPPPAPPTAWRLRLGRFSALVEPMPPVAAATAPGGTAARTGGHAPPARIGATIGVLERLLIVTFVLTGSTAAIGFVVAAKTLARFKQLDDRDFAEYYLLGTLASVAVALGSSLIAQAALATVR